MADDSTYTDLNPSPRLLLGPGPSTVHPRVLRAMATPLVGHLDPHFIAIMDEIQELLRMVFKAPDATTIPISGTGSAGMEAALCNFIEEGDPVLICVNGYFGERLTDMAKRYGADVARVEAPWGEIIQPEQVEEALKKRPAKIVIIVHGETSTGVCQPLEEIGKIAHQYGALFLVDTVASLGGVPVEMKKWGIDIIYSGSQKCLSAPPGLAPLGISDKALEILKNRKTPVANWYLDLNLLLKYWGPERAYHHTAPISMNYALREALRLVAEEGLANVIARHQESADLLWAELGELNMKPLIAPAYRHPPLTTVELPDGIDEANVRSQLLNDYNIEVAGGLGAFKGKVWRIGLMGHSARKENVLTLLGALKNILG